jgi:hypothetical protein
MVLTVRRERDGRLPDAIAEFGQYADVILIVRSEDIRRFGGVERACLI